MPAAQTTARSRRAARSFWPVALVLFAVPIVAELLLYDPFSTAKGLLTALTFMPVFLAIVVAGHAVGGRRGWAVGVGLLVLAAYWTWWFGWGVDNNGSGFSLGMAATGLAEASEYHLELAVLLWPFVLVAVAATGLIARRRRRPAWPALGLLALVLVVAALPSSGRWSDGCNVTAGASPLITRPFVGALMDVGIGVLPGGSKTMAECPHVGDREWKPFWRGSDGLPPAPGLQRALPYDFAIPQRLYRDQAGR